MPNFEEPVKLIEKVAKNTEEIVKGCISEAPSRIVYDLTQRINTDNKISFHKPYLVSDKGGGFIEDEAAPHFAKEH